MKMRKILPCVLTMVLSLVGCDAKEQSGKAVVTASQTAQAQQNKSWMNCTVDGDKFTASGNQVDIGSLGASGQVASLALGMHQEKDGMQHSVSSGLMGVQLREGRQTLPEKGNGNLADYTIKNGKSETVKGYSGMYYSLYYATADNDPDGVLELNIAKVSKKPSNHPMVASLHIAGNFSTNVVYIPKDMPDACLKETITRQLTKGPRFPVYNAGLCGAEKRRIACDFEVTSDIPDQSK